jgi:hypothetical protein
MNIELNEENFFMYACKYYNNPGCHGIKEFNEDLKRFKYLKRLFRKVDLRERLIINHLVILNNIFGPEVCNNLLFYKIGKEHWSQLKTFLVFLNFISENAPPDVELDSTIADTLRKI